nr:hypothetical protein CFP56_48622 [Quercus suber]
MAEGEEPLGFGDASTTGLAVPESEATTGGVAEAVAGGDDVEVSDELEGSPYHIIESSINVVLLQTFIWEHLKDYIDVGKDVGDVKATNWVVEVAGPNALFLCCSWVLLPKPFPNARPRSQEFGLNDHEKILNFLLVTSPSFIPYPSGASEKNVIAKAPETNPATSAPKRSHGKSPSSEDKPKKVIRKRASAKKLKAGSPKPPTIIQSGSSVASDTKPSVPAAAFASSSLPLKQYRRKTRAGRVQILETSKESGDSEGTPSEGYDLEYVATDFGKLLFLASVSSCVSFPDVLCSLGPTDEDIKMAGESPAANVTTREIAIRESSKEPVGKDLDVTVTTRGAIVGVPSQRHVISSIVHGIHQSKEPLELWVESSGVAIKGMSLEEFLEKFAKDEENEKVANDFYPVSSDTIMFQWSEIHAEGQPLLAAIVRKHLHFMAGCKLGASLRKFGLQLLIAVLLDMQRTKLESSNLKKALEWKNSLKDLFMKFGVQFILDKIRVNFKACIARDDEFIVKIADLEREIPAKRAELSFMLSWRDEMMWSSSAGGASSSSETFGDGFFD